MDLTSTAWPMADERLTQELLDVIQQAGCRRQTKKGVNEAIKALRRNISDLVIIAGDACPLTIVMPLPILCEDNYVPYIFVPSKIALGRACGVSRAVIAVSINTNDASDLKDQIQQLKRKVDRIAT
ncbi:ribonucleoprotein-associated protein [Penicillium malachiteum]|nr:ribonucleoprotein-associated protein [Penicillium malachiteum]